MTTNNNNAAAFGPKVGGGVYYAPIGTALPADATTALDPAFVGLGLVNEDGLQPEREVNTEKPKDWNGDVVLQLKTDDSKSFTFTLLEVFNGDVQTWINGADNVTVTPATTESGTTIAVVDKAADIDNCVLVFDMKFRGKQRRIVVPVANSTVSGEGAMVPGTLGSYEITTEATKDTSGARVYDYLVNDDLASV